MQPISTILIILIASYLIGSIPFGWIIVKLVTGRDVRGIESGRTGGTNVWRAAGLFAGLLTGILDILKGAGTVWIARALMGSETFPLYHWIEVAAPLLAILGHNYSIYLLERHEHTGRVRLRGGAGGAACLGGAVGLWSPSILIILPLGLLVYFFIGYASVTTMSVALFSSLIFAVTAVQLGTPWQWVLYGVVAEVMLVWALRPNIQRLREGTERIHGFRPWLRKRREAKQK